MDILLLQDVEGVGKAGEVQTVTGGYARHYLIPRGLAVVATEGALKEAEGRRQAEAGREERQRAKFEDVAARMEKITLNFKAKVGEKEKLYGSITSGDIAEALERELGESIDKRKIDLPEPIRELGSYQVAIRLRGDLSPEVTIVVEEASEGG
ncbi:MAG: 50S ribosomal protein L9 [Anaerolineae bacterium]